LSSNPPVLDNVCPLRQLHAVGGGQHQLSFVLLKNHQSNPVSPLVGVRQQAALIEPHVARGSPDQACHGVPQERRLDDAVFYFLLYTGRGRAQGEGKDAAGNYPHILTSTFHFVQGREMPVISASWKASLKILSALVAEVLSETIKFMRENLSSRAVRSELITLSFGNIDLI
jgi:hypothetical protein